MEDEHGILSGRSYGSILGRSGGGIQPSYGGSLNWDGNLGSAALGVDHTRGIGTMVIFKILTK